MFITVPLYTTIRLQYEARRLDDLKILPDNIIFLGCGCSRVEMQFFYGVAINYT